jgi:hypothetical protein
MIDKMVKPMNYGKILFGLFLALNLMAVMTFAAAGVSNIQGSLYCVYSTVKNVLAVGMLLLVVLAAVIYAVGQVLGAETRARASVWATAMFVGAIIGAMIYLLLPYILSTLFAGDSMVSYINSPSLAKTVTC